jgi:hypothetical protein
VFALMVPVPWDTGFYVLYCRLHAFSFRLRFSGIHTRLRESPRSHFLPEIDCTESVSGCPQSIHTICGRDGAPSQATTACLSLT